MSYGKHEKKTEGSGSELEWKDLKNNNEEEVFKQKGKKKRDSG